MSPIVKRKGEKFTLPSKYLLLIITILFKGFKTIAVTTSGSVAKAKLSAVGVPGDMIMPLVQPVAIDSVGIGNPWTNYSYYLTPSFSFGCLGLIIMIFTAYTPSPSR